MNGEVKKILEWEEPKVHTLSATPATMPAMSNTGESIAHRALYEHFGLAGHVDPDTDEALGKIWEWATGKTNGGLGEVELFIRDKMDAMGDPPLGVTKFQQLSRYISLIGGIEDDLKKVNAIGGFGKRA